MKKVLLFLMALTTVALVGCGNGKENEEIELNNNVEPQVQEEIEDNESEAIAYEPTSADEIVDLFNDYIDQLSQQSGDGLTEYIISSVNILSDEEKADLISNFPNEYYESDVLATVTFSVKPENPGSMSWQAGNGEVSGDWIMNKSLVVTLRDGKLTNIGTGW